MAREDLPDMEVTGLTERQELFCQIYCDNDNLTNKQVAVRAGYPEAAAVTKSKSLLANPRIRARIAEIKDDQERMFACDSASHMRQLAKIRDAALNAGQFAAAHAAEKSRGQVAGLYVFRQEINVTRVDQMSADQLKRELVEFFKRHPELAPPTEYLSLEPVNVKEAGTASLGPPIIDDVESRRLDENRDDDNRGGDS